ncbi:hypothetical protein Trydic_g23684 [Trypoxylus dichotomus]
MKNDGFRKQLTQYLTRYSQSGNSCGMARIRRWKKMKEEAETASRNVTAVPSFATARELAIRHLRSRSCTKFQGIHIVLIKPVLLLLEPNEFTSFPTTNPVSTGFGPGSCRSITT